MSGIYIHIPFCRKACHYCDFHFSTSLRTKNDFVNALLSEIDLRKNYLANQQVETIYFGGGTPSVLDAAELEKIISKIRTSFSVTPNAEITLEANPDDLRFEYLKDLKTNGINRLSIGVQSFDDDILKWMNRTHNAKRATESVQEAKQAGIENISIDLIYAVPGLSISLWEETILKAAALPVSHLSCYALTVEEKTALSFFVRKGKVKLPDDELAEKHFEILRNVSAQNNFEQYEISNFAREKKYSRHNSNYWTGAHYLGLGPSAHSYNGISRQWNLSNNFQYIKNINENLPFFEMEKLSLTQKFNETIMTRLRTAKGISTDFLLEEFGKKYADYFEKATEKFLKPNILIRQNNNFTFSPEHWFKADSIISDLFFIE